MSTPRFRVWFGDAEASEDDLARIEEIEVTQEIDKFWEARIRTTMCLDAQGHWQHRSDTVAAAFTRMRVELDAGNGTFVPLIDGPVTSFDSRMDSQPGRSTATFVVRDDSVFLNRDEGTEVFRDKTDSQVADELLRSVDAIDDTRIEATSATHAISSRRGTKLRCLSELARANERRVFVLPGPEPGKSIGCFLSDPRQAEGDLPALTLIGDARNLGDATIEEDSESPERTSAQRLRIADGALASFQTSAADLGVGGDRPALPADLTPLRLLPPADATREDPQAAASGRARQSGYAYKLSSRLIPGCYAAALQPHRRVRIECGDTPYSGDWLLAKVVHRITPSIYTQSFEAWGDAGTEVSAAPVAEATGGGLSLSFSASVGVF
ncbi:MAG TPA: hypothetical protein PLB41_00190 [Rubrivivax sp.]|nr:hypothetical protein [Rubrivivax sp.]